MKVVIKPGQRWQFVGRDDTGTAGLVHTVVGCSPQEIVTWSRWVDRGSLGFSWLGPVHDFLRNFRPVVG